MKNDVVTSQYEILTNFLPKHLAHLICNPGNAGSIPTHGICVFSFKMDESVFRTGS